MSLAAQVSHLFRAMPDIFRVSVAGTVAYRAQLVIWVLTTTMPLIMLALGNAVVEEAPLVQNTVDVGTSSEFRSQSGRNGQDVGTSAEFRSRSGRNGRDVATSPEFQSRSDPTVTSAPKSKPRSAT